MAETTRFLIDRTDTPIGELVIIADREGHLRAVDWTEHEARMLQLLRLHYGEKGYTLEEARDPGGLTVTMRAYFSGKLDVIDTLPVRTAGTDFQREVWAALRSIPCGSTVSYSELARRIGRPTAVRAVGLANGANPVGIVVPCHRVVGANGSLTGYGGGIQRKRWLLSHESRALPLLKS
ncbi:methylated-DNA--[protein]-cysteine S-methyltransferase [Myxococcus sp. K38C18041901]|uniref:methylated-DNA--[protein]-cysteine S-methyltransferase n=1 Tax=Myxococcus guangdongensis TaxID=2906760 RepID=UPI0020A8080F|nr:methylated-DNA--[protein]-cysteine S-methyltransferase [Myxococcus guangdongensis]MCP3061020.1 methylated-DNA--[protein]-cysteine S-methyltransferase [Myxococcus guangdongensis]